MLALLYYFAAMKGVKYYDRVSMSICVVRTYLYIQEGQHELTGQRAANFRRDLEAT